MDVERTIEFILKTQAKTEIQLAGITKLVSQGMRMLAKHDANIAQLTKAQEKLTKAQKGTQTTVAELSHIVGELARAQKRTEVKMAELSDAQKATERTLKTFISSLGRWNGRNSHKT